ncbi:MAG: chlororespiratory reduction protein 7 [Prochlorothrix sp.]|nr:chlororespiratory reduction protein 7 [Prochlorothrix sp.]
MSNLMYQEEHYVVLEPGTAEVFLSASEMLTYLQGLLQRYAPVLSPDVAQQPTPLLQAQCLLDRDCELEIEPGRSVQWYAVRLEK